MLTARAVKSATLYFMFISRVRPKKYFSVNKELKNNNKKREKLLVKQ